MLRALLTALAAMLLLSACNEAPTRYRECPPGVDPGSYDCVRTSPDPDAADTSSADGETDTSRTLDTSTAPDTGVVVDTSSDVCVPSCAFRTCGPDGCGGVCGRCAAGERCFEGGCLPPDTPDGLTCREIVDCVQPCVTDGCRQDCYDRGSPLGQGLFAEAVECLEVNCGDLPPDSREYQDCGQTFCGDVFEECFASELPADLTCPEVIDCMIFCRDDGSCQEDCFFSGTREARRSVEDVIVCLEDTGGCMDVGSIEEFYDCLFETCPFETDRCFEGDGPFPPPEPVCNPDDLDAYFAAGDELPIILVECGWSCTGAAGNVDERCATRCTTLSLGIGEACGGCAGMLTMCTMSACRERCEDPLSDACAECVRDRCEPEFFACTDTPG